ncbi:hypothetical protein J4G37_37740, partial [Microvirga sp. 3-52]|nr:hypothetical protein [Microvirga sp. 3-52]
MNVDLRRGYSLNKINKNHIVLSLLLCFLVPLFIPSSLSTDGKESYVYGLPLEYVTIYQQNPNSGWFFDNFFNGNTG